MNKRITLNTLYYIGLGLVFIYIYTDRLGLFDSFYLYVLTITTVGYGDFSGKNEAEKIMSMIAAISPYVTFATELILLYLRRKPKKMYKHTNILIVAHTTTRLRELIEGLKDQPRIFILCDNHTPANEQVLTELSEKYPIGFRLVDSVYDKSLFEKVETIDKALILQSMDLSADMNTHRSIGISHLIESMYPSCTTVTEVPSLNETILNISQGDLYTEQVPTQLYVQELKDKGSIDRYYDLINKSK